MLFETSDLCKKYKGGSGSTFAVKNACIYVAPNETVSLFGESGCGKSTFAMMAAGLLKPTSGAILFHDAEISMNYKGVTRKKIQILFQHPETTFNPVLNLIHSMKEPYKLYDIPYSYEGMLQYLKNYGLYEEHLYRTPAQLSGGELQRAALARILMIEPELIILDEPTSMLDAITQVQIINMLKTYQKEHGTSYILISHNRALCQQTSDRIYNVENGVFTEEK